MKDSDSSCTAVAPCSTANFGPGFDIFGLALDALQDTVTIKAESADPGRQNNSASLSRKDKLTISIEVGGEGSKIIPTVPENNSAGIVVKKMAADFDIRGSINVSVNKGVPAGFGMGSSAASAAAAALAFNELFGLKVEKSKLVEYAAEGELASAGTRHYDNVAASVLGGFVIVGSNRDQNLVFTSLEAPTNLVLVVAVPSMEVPEKKTGVARSVLPKAVPIESAFQNVSNASIIVAGFGLKNVELIAYGIHDAIVEPARKHLIPGYEAVKRKAQEAGALATTISGAGPSMISILDGEACGKSVASAMAAGFNEAGLKSRTFVCRPSLGAKIV